jgi:hypothetical protein
MVGCKNCVSCTVGGCFFLFLSIPWLRTKFRGDDKFLSPKDRQWFHFETYDKVLARTALSLSDLNYLFCCSYASCIISSC